MRGRREAYPVVDGHRRCLDCGEVKPVGDFYQQDEYVLPNCKACTQFRNRMRRETPADACPPAFEDTLEAARAADDRAARWVAEGVARLRAQTDAVRPAMAMEVLRDA